MVPEDAHAKSIGCQPFREMHVPIIFDIIQELRSFISQNIHLLRFVKFPKHRCLFVCFVFRLDRLLFQTLSLIVRMKPLSAATCTIVQSLWIALSRSAVIPEVPSNLQNILKNTHKSQLYTYPTDFTRGIIPVSFVGPRPRRKHSAHN